MIDPWTFWEDGFPYLLLADAGVSPSSDMSVIKDAGFSLSGPEQRRAWDALRIPARRLLIDFFLYQEPPSGDGGPASV